jgi:hypothetical protein
MEVLFMSSSVYSAVVRIWLCLLGVLAWMAILLDNATTSFCLTVPCCEGGFLYEGNPMTRFFISLFGLDWVLWANSGLSLLIILWIYERVIGTMSNRAIWMGSLTFILLVLVRGQAAFNNWNIFVQVLTGKP